MFHKYLVPLTLSCRVEQKLINTSTKLHLKVVGVFKYVWLFVTTGHERVKIIRHVCVSFTSEQNFTEERLNSQKLIWFYLLEFFLFTIIFLPNFVASNYKKVIADIWIIFVSYSFYICLPLFWGLDPCPPKILDAFCPHIVIGTDSLNIYVD